MLITTPAILLGLSTGFNFIHTLPFWNVNFYPCSNSFSLPYIVINKLDLELKHSCFVNIYKLFIIIIEI